MRKFKTTDVTTMMDFQNNDDESLPITECLCGAKFRPWDFVISIYEDNAYACPSCGEKFFFRLGVRVFRVEEENAQEM